LLYFFITLSLSTIFAVAGLGSAIALVPTLHLSGLAFDLARVCGLFVNSVSTATISLLNYKKRVFDLHFAAPLVVSSMLMAYLGANVSFMVEEELVKSIFGYTLLVLASMILFVKIQAKEHSQKGARTILIVAGSIGGFFSGFLGIGGGSIISPILILFGYDPKKVAIGISFVIPFSSLIALMQYLQTVDMEIPLLLTIGVGAYIGGRVGNYLLHFKVSSQMIKKILAGVLYLLAYKMII
jgi:uncharacterized membrane protein YfcA